MVKNNNQAKEIDFIDAVLSIVTAIVAIWLIGNVLQQMQEHFVGGKFDFSFYSDSVAALVLMGLSYYFGIRAVSGLSNPNDNSEGKPKNSSPT